MKKTDWGFLVEQIGNSHITSIRGGGSTTVFVHSLATYVQLEVPYIILILGRDTDYVIEMIYSIFKEYGLTITFKKSNPGMNVNKTVLSFSTSRESAIQKARGRDCLILSEK